ASVSVKKTNDVVKLQAIIDKKKVVVTEDTIRQDLRLDDADGVECLPNEEIFAELARMGYEKPPPKLTFYKAFLRMHQNRGKIAKLDVDEDVTLVDVDNALEMDADIQGRMEEDVTAVKEINVAEPEPLSFDDKEVTMTMAQTLIKMKAKKAKLLDEHMAKRLHDEEVEQMQEKHLDNIRKYQSLKRKLISVDQARKNMIVYLKNMVGYKIAHFKGMTYDQVRPIFEREYNKVQTFLKSDRDEEPAKKRGAEETLLQKSFKKLIAEVKASGSHSTQDTPTDDPKEMSEEDVKNMLQIVSVAELKVEALQVKLTKEKFSTAMPTEDKEKALLTELKRLYEPNAVEVFWKLQRYMHDPLTWKLYTNCGVHQVSSTRRYDIFMFPEKDYPLTDAVLSLMLSTKLQVDEDYEMARDLVMKIFMEANKPKSRRISVKKTNNVVKLQALIDKKKVVITEDTIRQDLRLDDADGVECLPNEGIFAELARMGYEKPPPKLTFYKAFFMVRNVDSPSKFLMYSRFIQVMINAQVDDLSSHTTKYTSRALTQKVFANMRRIGKGFLGVETPLFTTMFVQPQAAAEEDEAAYELPAAPTPPSPTHEPSPPPQAQPAQAQPAPPSSPPQEQHTQPTHTSESFMTLLNTLMETCATLTQKVAHLEQDKVAQALEITKLKQRVKKLKMKRRSKHYGLKRRMHQNRGKIAKLDVDEDVTLVDVDNALEMDADIQGRMEEDVTAVKEINAAEPEPLSFDDKEVTKTMAQTLIKMKAKKAKLLDEHMAKRLHDEEVEQMQEKHLDNIRKYQSLKRKPISVDQARKNMIVYLKNMVGYNIAHFKGMTYDQVRPIFEREYNKVQTFLKSDRDEEPAKKRGAEETLLQKSFKKLIVEVEASGSHSTQDTPTDDPKEMSEEDVKNMLQIVLVAELKVEALQVKLTKEKFSTTMPTEDKEKALLTELKRLYEPNAVEVFWKLQRYMHDPLTWKLYTNCGVHQVSSTRRYDIFMFPEKDYPLTDAVLFLMLSTKLQVDEDCEMARDLVMKIFMEANKPKSRRSLDTSS
nr:hypothetical protein [Tanacetum cinerariifolium]